MTGSSQGPLAGQPGSSRHCPPGAGVTSRADANPEWLSTSWLPPAQHGPARAGDPFQRVAVRHAAVAVAHDAGRDRLAGPGGAAVPGEPELGAGWGAGGHGPGVVPAGHGGDRVTGAGAGTGDVQQAQAAGGLPLGDGGIADHASRQREPGDVYGEHAGRPVRPGVVRHQDGSRPGDHVAGGRGCARDPVQRRPDRAGLVVPGFSAVGGGQQSADVPDREATRRGQAADVGQGARGAAALRMPGRGRRGGGGSGRGRGRAAGHRGQGQGHQRGLHECRCYHGYHARPARRASTARASLLSRSAP